MDDAKFFIVGANGQLGTALKKKYPNAQSADVGELDITNKDSVLYYDWSNIEVILNAAAFTNVDGAETDEGRIAAWKVNATAVGYLSEVARQEDITLIHISSDYVFDGTQANHSENEDLSPLSVYGASKAAGDLLVQATPKHYLLRTSWVIGEGNNFVRTMLGLGAKGINPSVVNDQIGRLTFTDELVKAIDHLLSSKAEYGLYNISNDGEPASWADIAREIFKLAGYANSVTGVTTEKYYEGKNNIALRPLQSSLDLSKITATGYTPTDWKQELENYIKEEQK